ncbi:hypothetical protein B0H19DRAFT_1224504 [Mycena capillaripes]|nr:hypothetical protein B0H19DRAFT_1224504 [Mycena capillaripes]
MLITTTMAPTLSHISEADCHTTFDIAAEAFQGFPCLRCTLIALAALITIIFITRLLLPARLCTTMRTSLNATEKLYHGSLIAGIYTPSSQPDISEEFRRLQFKVSHIEERRVRNLLKPWCTIWDMLTGHSFAIGRCIWDIEVLRNQIESGVSCELNVTGQSEAAKPDQIREQKFGRVENRTPDLPHMARMRSGRNNPYTTRPSHNHCYPGVHNKVTDEKKNRMDGTDDNDITSNYITLNIPDFLRLPDGLDSSQRRREKSNRARQTKPRGNDTEQIQAAREKVQSRERQGTRIERGKRAQLAREFTIASYERQYWPQSAGKVLAVPEQVQSGGPRETKLLTYTPNKMEIEQILGVHEWVQAGSCMGARLIADWATVRESGLGMILQLENQMAMVLGEYGLREDGRKVRSGEKAGARDRVQMTEEPAAKSDDLISVWMGSKDAIFSVRAQLNVVYPRCQARPTYRDYKLKEI